MTQLQILQSPRTKLLLSTQTAREDGKHAVHQEFGVRMDSDHPGITMQRAPLSYLGREEGKKAGERQNEVMTIIVLKLKRISKCFLKLSEVLSKTDHTFHPAPNDRNHHSTLWLLPQYSDSFARTPSL